CPGADVSQLVAMMRAVVEARAHRYLMLDAPKERVDEICAVIGSRSPSVLPLAEPGMVAVHALVPAKDVWQLLPKLEAVGAFSILIVPVERMLPIASSRRSRPVAMRPCASGRSSSTGPSLRAPSRMQARF